MRVSLLSSLRPLELFQYIVSDVGDFSEQFHGLCGVGRGAFTKHLHELHDAIQSPLISESRAHARIRDRVLKFNLRMASADQFYSVLAIIRSGNARTRARCCSGSSHDARTSWE